MSVGLAHYSACVLRLLTCIILIQYRHSHYSVDTLNYYKLDIYKRNNMTIIHCIRKTSKKIFFFAITF